MSDLHLHLHKVPKKDKRQSKTVSEGSHILKKHRDSVSTTPYLDDLPHHEEIIRMVVTKENTYQMGPFKCVPVSTITNILKNVLTTNLKEEKYEVEWSQKMTRTLSEVIRSRMRDLMILRYKIVVLVHIGQLTGQSMQISSRCLWDASHDTVASYSLKNSSLFGLATVYAVYHE